MGFVTSADTINISCYLTTLGRQYYLSGETNSFEIKYFSLDDSDVNYNASAITKINGDKNILNSGEIPDLTGDKIGCINSIAAGIDLKYKIKTNVFDIGFIRNQYCDNFTLYKEVYIGNGKFQWQTEINSASCGFYFKSNPINVSKFKNNCTNGGVSEPYNVTIPLGAFTGNTQAIADQNAYDYLVLSAQTIANNNGICVYYPNQPISVYLVIRCNNNGSKSIVSVSNTNPSNLPNTDHSVLLIRNINDLNNVIFKSSISNNDANNIAMSYYTNIGNLSLENEFINFNCNLVSNYPVSQDLILNVIKCRSNFTITVPYLISGNTFNPLFTQFTSTVSITDAYNKALLYYSDPIHYQNLSQYINIDTSVISDLNIPLVEIRYVGEEYDNIHNIYYEKYDINTYLNSCSNYNGIDALGSSNQLDVIIPINIIDYNGIFNRSTGILYTTNYQIVLNNQTNQLANKVYVDNCTASAVNQITSCNSYIIGVNKNYYLIDDIDKNNLLIGNVNFDINNITYTPTYGSIYSIYDSIKVNVIDKNNNISSAIISN